MVLSSSDNKFYIHCAAQLIHMQVHVRWKCVLDHSVIRTLKLTKHWHNVPLSDAKRQRWEINASLLKQVDSWGCVQVFRITPNNYILSSITSSCFCFSWAVNKALSPSLSTYSAVNELGITCTQLDGDKRHCETRMGSVGRGEPRRRSVPPKMMDCPSWIWQLVQRDGMWDGSELSWRCPVTPPVLEGKGKVHFQ